MFRYWRTLMFISIGLLACDGGQTSPQTTAQPDQFGNLHIDSESDLSRIQGSYETSEGQVVAFDVQYENEIGTALAEMWMADAPEQKVISTVSGPKSGSITFQGRTVDGFGSTTREEQQVLEDLSELSLGRSIPLLSLELGCLLSPQQTAQHQASLVLPWQILLKYVPTFPRPETSAKNVECPYFDEQIRNSSTEPPPVPSLILGNETAFPGIFGFAPFDAVGESRTKIEPRPCGAHCWGTCGPDCARSCVHSIDIECEIDGDNNQTGRILTTEHWDQCGSHQGCRDHDQCYDDCNEHYGCGTVSSFLCMHNPYIPDVSVIPLPGIFLEPINNAIAGCDYTACVRTYGEAACGLFALGLPGLPFDRFDSFEYQLSSDADPETCPPHVPPSMSAPGEFPHANYRDGALVRTNSHPDDYYYVLGGKRLRIRDDRDLNGMGHQRGDVSIIPEDEMTRMALGPSIGQDDSGHISLYKPEGMGSVYRILNGRSYPYHEHWGEAEFAAETGFSRTSMFAHASNDFRARYPTAPAPSGYWPPVGKPQARAPAADDEVPSGDFEFRWDQSAHGYRYGLEVCPQVNGRCTSDQQGCLFNHTGAYPLNEVQEIGAAHQELGDLTAGGWCWRPAAEHDGRCG